MSESAWETRKTFGSCEFIFFDTFCFVNPRADTQEEVYEIRCLQSIINENERRISNHDRFFFLIPHVEPQATTH